MIIIGDIEFNCPHCNKAQEGTIGDYVISYRSGTNSIATTECGWCDAEFSVGRKENDRLVFEVWK